MKRKSWSWITGCFVIATCLILGIAYSRTTEAADCKHNGYITESIAIDEYRKSKNTDGWYSSVPKSENGDEWIFAGWYEDNECTTPLGTDVVTGTYTAKFVPSHVLSVKAQIPVSLLNAENATTGDMRFVTSVDSVQYNRVGISVLLPTGKTFSSSQRGVYENLYAVGDDKVVQSYRANEVFCSVSRYFKAYTIRQIPSQYFDADFRVTPYWITLDGSFVNGETVTKNMKQCLNDVTKLVINDSAHGTVTADMEHYYVGDSVTLQVTPDENYDCTTLTVDGKELRSEEDGTYLFEASKTQHTVNATFERKIFADASGWDLSRQHEGIVTLKNGGYNGNLYMADKYTDVDLTLTVRNYTEIADGNDLPRTAVKFNFADGKHVQFSVLNQPPSQTKTETGAVYLQVMGENGSLLNWSAPYTFSTEEKALFESAEGIKFRIVKTGTIFTFYINGEQKHQINLSDKGLTADMEAGINIRHWGDAGVDVELPFSITTGTFAKASGWDLTKQHEGIVTLKNEGYNGNLYMADKYTDVDLTLTVRNYTEIADGNDSPRTAVKFNFAGGKHVQFSVLNQPPSQTKTETGAVYLQVMGENGSLLNWSAPYTFSAEEKALFESAEGIKFRIVKTGTIFTFYINGEQKHQINLSDKGLTADMEAGINIRHWGDAGVDVELPFVIKKAVTFKGATVGHGTITSTPATCYEGDTVTLNVTPDEAYDCTGLKVDGKTVNMNTDGTYTFVAKKTVYELEASYRRKIFADASGWDLSRQHEGSVTLKNGGYNGNLYMADKYTDVDLTLTVRNYAEITDGDDSPRTAVKFNFAGGKHVQFSVLNQPPSQTKTETGAVYLQVMGENGSLLNWGAPYTFSAEEKALFESTEGIKFRIVKTGTIFTFYINGEQKHQINLSDKGLTADMEAGINIRHWGDAGVDVELPFVIKNAVTLKGLTSENGIVKTEKTKYFVGDTVTFTVSPDTGYYCTGVKVNGKELTADENGKYLFVADKDVCNIKVTYGGTLFCQNNKNISGSDPFVLDNTARDGYYYMYVTYGNYCYRSKNLMDWETVGNTIDGLSGWGDIWAPEVVYDEDTKLYYMFFSATPPSAGNVKYQMLLATSESPDKGFQLVDFTDKHDYDTSTYSQEYAKYLYLDPAKYNTFARNNGGVASTVGGYECAIDPHPYVDKDGQKYLLWTDSSTSINRICGMKMKGNDWLTPDWTTAKVLTYANYYTVSDYNTAQNTLVDSKVDTVSDEGGINEGSELIYHNNKYYLTYSVGTYGKNTYQVRQAVADSPLGTYTKLTEDEGGILLKGYYQSGQGITGTGHHSFVTVGEQLYMVYHRHDTPYNAGTDTGGGNSRNIAIDEVKWVTNKNGLEVLYANGPTITLQPAIEQFSAFKNIAEEAKISGDGVTNLSYLTDGLLSIYGTDKESSISKTTTITFDFDKVRIIGGVMVYNSSEYHSTEKNRCFTEISKIECVCIENGKEIVRTISNVTFDSNYFVNEDVIPGAAAYTTMDEWNVKSMRITIEVPDGQNQVGISEIKILGKK